MRYATAALSAMKAKDAAGRPEDDVAYISLLLVWLQSIVVYILAVVVELWWQLKISLGIQQRDQFITLPGYAPVVADHSYFFTRRIYTPMRDCWDRPIDSVPGELIDVLERTSEDCNRSYKYTGTTRRCINLGSYNYLGFAEKEGPVVDTAVAALHQYGTSPCSSRSVFGTLAVQRELENKIASFVGKEDAVIFNMGFATNSTTLPALVGPGDLIISDALNHASVVAGCRSSGAKTTIFRHNCAQHLEKVLKAAVTEGQPTTHLPWNMILIVVEGIYSMEGEVCALAEIVAVKKKYGAYLYLDEAHSIGAIGRTGRGVTEYTGVDPADVDIMMGTFTKSFASVGGYVAGSKELISYLRHSAFSALYDTSMTGACAQQALSALSVIDGSFGTLPADYPDGIERVRRLRENSMYFRKRLQEMGYAIMGAYDSPVIPALLIHPGKLCGFSRDCLRNNLAVVVVGPPVTPFWSARARFCLSSRLTREMLEESLEVLEVVGRRNMVFYHKYKTQSGDWNPFAS